MVSDLCDLWDCIHTHLVWGRMLSGRMGKRTFMCQLSGSQHTHNTHTHTHTHTHHTHAHTHAHTHKHSIHVQIMQFKSLSLEQFTPALSQDNRCLYTWFNINRCYSFSLPPFSPPSPPFPSLPSSHSLLSLSSLLSSSPSLPPSLSPFAPSCSSYTFS